jgi:peptidyl-dipeptidase Dcp
MKKTPMISLIALFAVMSSFHNGRNKEPGNKYGLPASNPFSSVSKLPYQAPAFDKIKNADYKPAMEQGIKEQM